jgi:hypothetical protein
VRRKRSWRAAAHANDATTQQRRRSQPADVLCPFRAIDTRIVHPRRVLAASLTPSAGAALLMQPRQPRQACPLALACAAAVSGSSSAPITVMPEGLAEGDYTISATRRRISYGCPRASVRVLNVL